MPPASTPTSSATALASAAQAASHAALGWQLSALPRACSTAEASVLPTLAASTLPSLPDGPALAPAGEGPGALLDAALALRPAMAGVRVKPPPSGSCSVPSNTDCTSTASRRASRRCCPARAGW